MVYSNLEYFEIIGDSMEEVREWQDFEADMATHPWDTEENKRGA